MSRQPNPECPKCHGRHVNVMIRQLEECPDCWPETGADQDHTATIADLGSPDATKEGELTRDGESVEEEDKEIEADEDTSAGDNA